MRSEDHPLKPLPHVYKPLMGGKIPKYKGGHVISLCINEEVEFQSNFTLLVRLV